MTKKIETKKDDFDKKNKRKKGAFYEDLAKKWLEKKGYNVILSNYQAGHLEIDLVALHQDTLAIVEVKYRKIKKEEQHKLAYHSVGIKKQKNLIKATNFFLMKNPKYKDTFQRFDVLLILDRGHEVSVEHLQNAFHAKQEEKNDLDTV